MKNIQLFNIRRDKIAVREEGPKNFLFVNNKLYVVSNTTLTEYEKGLSEVVNQDYVLHDILQFEYLKEEKQLWIGTQLGFFCIDPIDKQIRPITLDGEPSLDVAVYESAAWSPSQESLVVIKSDGEIQVYALSLRDTILVPLEGTLLSVDISQGIAIGWGSDQRQFRSPEEQAETAKFIHEKPIKENNIAAVIAWRSNSNMFAVNCIVKDVRKLKVFEYPCTLIHQSEEVVGLQAPTVWRPTNNWITTFVWTDKRCQIVIFEKKCMERCRFNLTRNARVDKLQWLDSGELLAVLQGSEEATPANIDLYYFDNYEMHLKQRLVFDSAPLFAFDFLKEENSLAVLKVATHKEVIAYSFKYRYYTSQLLHIGQSTCMLISGSTVWITFSGDGLLLPMPGILKVTVDHPVNFVAMNSEYHNLAIVDCFDVVTVFKLERDGVDKLYTVNLRNEKEYVCPLQYYHFTWMKNNKLFFVSEKIVDKQMIDVCTLEQTFIENWQCKTNCISQKGINYSDIVENNDITLEEKFLLDFCDSIGTAVTHLYIKLVNINGNQYVFSLTSTNEFHINDTVAADCISSFIISEGYVFMTTVGDKLMGIRLNEQEINNFLNMISSIVYRRNIEHGALLICGIPDSSNLFMHVPRGNMEICTCRIVTVDLIEKYLKKGNWLEAMYLARLEKVNMNVLVDLNIDRFIENIEYFLEAVEKPAILNEFIFELEDNNIFEGKYSDCKIEAHKGVCKKTDIVCSKMIEYMENTNFTYYLTSLIAAHFVKNSITTVHHFLGYIKSILVLPNAQDYMELAKNAFKFICSLKTTQELYEGALLTYDLNLIRFVAQYSKMEQLEYQPFLEKLKPLDDVNLRFSINHHLKYYYQAYQYLSRCTSDIDELLNYIETHNIGSQVIWDVEEKDLGSMLHVGITHSVCKFLTLQRKYEEAATLYYKANLLNEAFLSYRSASCWTEAIHVLNKMNLDEEEFSKKLETVALILSKAGHFSDAAKIYENYLNKFENAFDLYLDSNMFSEALRVSRKLDCSDVYESKVLAGIVQYSSMLLVKIKQILEDYTKHRTRLNILRNEKRRNYENQAVKDLSVQAFNQTETRLLDTNSIIGTSTVASTMHSKSSHTSARSRRKQEMKKHSTKEGGEYEDIALMEALYNLIKEAFSLSSIVRELCLIVQIVQNVSKPPQPVIEIHNQLLDLQVSMKATLLEIWPSNLNLINNAPVDMAVYENVHVMDPTYRQPPPDLSISWQMSVFPDTRISHEVD